MDDGVVVEQGPPSDVLDRPSHERTRRFLQMVDQQGTLPDQENPASLSPT
jgi:ABC-type glutathione transport system ATPase component